MGHQIGNSVKSVKEHAKKLNRLNTQMELHQKQMTPQKVNRLVQQSDTGGAKYI